MYRIIDLDIDGKTTGDTRIEEIAMVEMPAIEQNFIYFASEKSFIVPQNISANACRARKYKEENPNVSCGTPVGAIRSSQLCDRRPISLDTVKRMYSYLSRHEVDLESSKSYDDGCGLLQFDSWGGKEALEWSKKIIKREEGFDYDISGLPDYENYPSGETKSNMLIKPIDFIEKIPYERKEDYVARCIQYHIDKGYDTDQATAICYSQSEEAFAIGEKVSFDYDETLTTVRGMGLAKHELQSGSEVYIISARGNKEPMLTRAKELGIPESRVYAVGSNAQKIQKIRDLKITKHYDNNDDVIDELQKIGIKGIDFMCSCMDAYAEIGERGGIKESDKAPKSDTPNPNPKGEGTAKGDASSTRGAEVSERVEGILKEKSDDFNERYKDKLGYGVNIGMLKSVYQRGVGAYNVSHSPEVKSAEQWALARVNAFLYLVKNGRPENSKYTGDYDLLPKDHPKAKEQLSQDFGLVGFIDGEPVFSTPEEAIMYGDKMKGCASYHVHKDEDGNEVYMGCDIHPEKMEQDFGVDEYSDEEKEAAKLLYWLKENDYQKFEAVMAGMNGATRQEVIDRNHKTPTTYFLYERVLDGFPDRDFCDSIENRYFRRLEIDLLRDTNRDFGHNRQPYSKWLYKGGPNCVHAWHKYLVQGEVFADQGMAQGTAGIPPKNLPNNGYYSEETKRKSEIAYIISQQNMSKQMFQYEKEKRMIYSPLMIPNILIPRYDEETSERYFVRFTPESIEKAQQLYMIEKRMDKTNLEHSNKKLPAVVMVESWIVSGKKDKSYELGFSRDNIPDGTWMGGFKVMDTPEGDYIWNELIKTGKVKGFSVEGEFLLKFSRQNSDDYLLEEIINIIKNINN